MARKKKVEIEFEAPEAPEGAVQEPSEGASYEEASEPNAEVSTVDPETVRTRYLRHDLEVYEIEDMRIERELQDEQIGKLTAELEAKKCEVASLKKRVEGLVEQGLATSRDIRAGFVFRDVEIRRSEERDASGVLEWIWRRVDTGEVVDRERIPSTKRQGALFG